MGDGEFKDEWSKSRSSSSMHVTSPTGKFDPYLPALPARITHDPNRQDILAQASTHS